MKQRRSLANSNDKVGTQWDQNLHSNGCKQLVHDDDDFDGYGDDEDRGEGVLEQLQLGEEGKPGSRESSSDLK